MSISGGLYKALLRGKEIGCTAVQMFLRSNMAWNPGKFTPADAEKFARTRKETGIAAVVAHNCYLVNLASTDPVTLKRSIEATAGELQRAEALGISALVMHPGAHLGAGVKAGLKMVAKNIDRAIRESQSRRVRILLETTSGQGTVLGSTFEELAEIIAQSNFAERFGVCYDTCHTFTAGYDIRTPETYEKTMRKFDRVIGLDRLGCFHFNDSLKDFGTHRDRHTHIGKGKLGVTAFVQVLNDTRFTSIPKILETPKETYRRKSWDVINLETLRSLVKKSQ
jgi:deoxyribonuclease-4